MKTAVLAVCLLFISTPTVFAQMGSICLFSDTQGTDCTISDVAPGLIQVHVVHMGTTGATAAEFSAPVPDCMYSVYLGDMSPFPLIIGTSQEGISIAYGECLSSPIHVLTMNIFGQGMSLPDCPFVVLPHPNEGAIYVVDCDQIKLTAEGGITYVNSTLPCACGMLPDPILYVNPLTIDLGPDGTEGQFVIANGGGGSLVWNVAESISWLDAAPVSGTGNATITVTVDRSGLMPGYHSGLVEVTSNGGNETVTVTLEVLPPGPVLGVTPPTLSFGPTDNVKWVTIFNTGTGDLEWTVTNDQPWLSLDPVAGTNQGDVEVSVDRTGLPDGTYNDVILIASNGGDGNVPVLMTVATQPVLHVVPTLLIFSEVATSRVFSISNVGFGTLNWSLSADESWIDIVPPLTGTGNATVTVNVDPANVPPGGPQTGHITVASNGGSRVVEVRFVPASPGQGGDIGVFADVSGLECNIVDAASGLLEVYVVHMTTAGAMASQFAAPMPTCMTGVTWLADSKIYPATIGNSQEGVAIGYGACYASPIHVLTIQYFAAGLSETCCMYPVIPSVNAPSGQIEVVNCAEELLWGNGLVSSVNADATCMCGVVKVEESTWGRVKAIYAPEHIKAIRR
ncbi:MAG: BACON domain-containing protein [Candidatus Latescibacterota bacterium]|nr:MAG: BACON domain-containing protein [Candidatus Latescibacterota bacterium]